MIMKLLLRHASSLLRIVLLLGALVFVNIRTKAQTSEQLADLPSAFNFLTADEVNSIIGDGKYYYIQFYYQNLAADLSYTQNLSVFLADCGLNESLQTKDYLPFSDYLQWKFVSSGEGLFKLQSKGGHFVGRTTDPNRYIACNEGSAVVFKIYTRNDGGYEIGLASDDGSGMNRVSGAQWANVCNWNRNDNNNLLRVAELKPNVAHIIYYRGEGVDNTNYAPATTRHYLTNSGSNRVSWSSAIENGNLEGNSTNNFSVNQPGSEVQNATITDNIGCSRGIRISSAGNNDKWDSQFFIRANAIIPNGKRIHVEFDYKASEQIEGVDAQAQSEVGRYEGNLPINLNFTTEWQHYNSAENGDIQITVNNFQTIALDLWKRRNIDYYFDNIVFTVDGESVIVNGNLDSNITNSFLSKVNGGQPSEATITYGDGCSRGISIYSPGNEGQEWDTQFFIRANDIVPIETTIHVEFDYRATQNDTIPTQSHGVPGAYHSTNMLGNLYFTTEWKHYSGDIVVNNNMGGSANDFQTIAFNLGRNYTGGEITYFFDNIIFNVPVTHDVSSRRSIIPSDMSLWSLPTAAAYHQDGLWLLEKADDDGTFYIKKFGTEEYLNAGASGLSDLGEKNASLGRYKLEDPTANRYTRVQNMKYETAALAANMFHWWNGYGSDAQRTDQTAYVDFQLGTMLSDGAVVAGSGNVDYLLYADLTGYTKMIIEGTPGVQVRVLMNRQESNNGPLTERDVTLDEDGKGEIDLSDFTYVHLNAIKIGWGNSGEVSVVSLVKEDGGIPSSPNYLNYSTSDGSPVYQINNDPDRDWYAGFYPVEVPIPNKDEFFQVIVRNTGNDEMLNHEGGTSTYTEDIDTRELWILEQVDDYKHYRLKDPKTGRYVRGVNSMTGPNESNNAETNPNSKFWTDFAIKWFFIGPLAKEIVVDHYVTHKMSYLKQYSDAYASLALNEQGLVSNTDAEWWNHDSQTQKVNHFEITHYVKLGETIKVPLPTVLNRQNDHIAYQRWYHYNDTTCNNELYPDGSDIEGLKSHVSLDTREDGDVQYFLYKNGIVTGDSLIGWASIGEDKNIGLRRYALRNFNYTNSDGKAFTVAADVSRYSEYTYQNETDPLDDDLEEPSLTMRYLFYMKDAKEMATNLTACTYGSNKWLEEKTFHFPAKQVKYDQYKFAGYKGEFIGLRHLFSDYWVFDGNGTGDENLVSAVDDAYGGKIEVVVDPQGTGIRKGGYNPHINLKGTADGDDDDYQGFYFPDLMKREPYRSYGDSRFICFRYPASGQIPNNALGKEAYVNVYLNNNGTRYQLAQFTLIFDAGTETLPWVSVNNSDSVKNTDRDPANLFKKAGKPIAKITFDYPIGSEYTFPDRGKTIHNSGRRYEPNTTIPESGPIPLVFDKTNYSFDGSSDEMPCTWGAYALIKDMTTTWGNHMQVLPANVIDDYGYGDPNERPLQADDGFQNAFLYIDASEQPGDICSAHFEGDFCPGDELMISGWISGANAYDDNGGSEIRCPGGVTLTVKGEHKVNGKLVTETLYRFCPGQCYELNNGTGNDGSDSDANRVIWQQFFFKFKVTQKYDRHWLEVNNNCVSSNGGDFMLDNIEVYAIVPEVVPQVNTPLCISVGADGETVSDMRLLKLSVEFNKLRTSVGVNEKDTDDHIKEMGVVFLDKYKFLETFKEQLKTLTTDQKHSMHLDDFDFATISLDALNDSIDAGRLHGINKEHPVGYEKYIYAFQQALLCDDENNDLVWHSANPEQNMHAAVMYFQWHTQFNQMPTYSFADAAKRTSPVYGETIEGDEWVVMNGNFPELDWKLNTDYYVLISNNPIDEANGTNVWDVFELVSDCNKANEFRIEPPMTVLGLERSEDTHDYVVCEGQIPTLVTELKGYDFFGNEMPMQGINYDWWLGDKANGVLPTLDNYHTQKKGSIRLDQALSTLRIYYPDVTDLDGIVGHLAVNDTPALTLDMVNYLKELVDAGQLVLHQSSISVPAEPVDEIDDPYFYLVACPIHDAQFKQALNPNGPTSIIENGTMESFETSSFYVTTPSTNGQRIPATITPKVGKYESRGIRVSTTAEGNSNEWDTQLFISANEVIPQGTTFHLEFDYKASDAVNVHVQAHAAPTANSDIGYNVKLPSGDNMNLDFTTEWQHFSQDIEVTTDMGTGNHGHVNSFQSLVFDLWKSKPIDYYFDNVELTVHKNQYVAFFCDEPQGLRVKIGEKAPTLKTGFVPKENGFNNYDYSAVNNAVLSIRLAKKEQFETVKHGTVDDAPEDDYCTAADTDKHFLWLPIRNAETQGGANKVIRKSHDYNIYLASTNDPVNDKTISQAMKKGLLPIVGKIVQLKAINTAGGTNLADQNDENRLCIYFINDFEVREGYSYTLSLPFQEEGDVNTCDGTILINLKIVPDYEVWTGAAGNPDWNNDENWRRADGNLGTSTEEPKDGAGRNNNELYVSSSLPTESKLKDYVTNFSNYRTAKDRIFRKGFAPLYCTHVLIKSNEWGDAPKLYDALDTESGKTELAHTPFPNLRDSVGWDGTADKEAWATPILRYDMQARHYDLWEETYGVVSNKGRSGDLIAEMYQVNSCDEIAFQPGAELLNAHLLNYNNAWVEYQLDNKRWYLLGSPLQGTISGEWYAPTGSAQQKTTYYEPVTFGEGYDRYSPAIYQRSWDKAKAVLYEVGANYSTNDDDQALNQDGTLPGSTLQGEWNETQNGTSWNTTGADTYLDRLGYKPFGDKKVNVAIKGVWSNTYNDAQVDYANGGFSVMVMNHLKNNDTSDNKSIIRLPKEDTMYDYYGFNRKGGDNVNEFEDIGTNTQLSDVRTKNRAKNRGRLKSDLLLPIVDEDVVNNMYQQIQRKETVDSRYGDKRIYTRVPTRVGANALPMTLQPFTESVSAGVSNMGFYLVENPFAAGLDMEKFFASNPGLEKKYWILTSNGQQLVQMIPDNTWVSPTEEVVTGEAPNQVTTYRFTAANAKVAPGQGFFVQATASGEVSAITFTADMQAQAQTRYGEPDAGEKFPIVVGTRQVMETVTVTYDDDGDPTTPEVPVSVDVDNDPDTPGVVQTVEVPKVDENGNYVVEEIIDTVTVYKYKQKTGDGYEFPLKVRTRSEEASPLGLVITAQRGGDKSSALVMQREEASNDFLPSEDTETFICIDDQKQVPTVYTLCGRLATTINSIHDFRSLPLGVESNSDAPCTLTFKGVEQLGDSISFYDALEQKLTPLESGMKFVVSGQTQNRYYLVRSLIQEEAAAETHIQIFTEGLTAKVIASTGEPITKVRCYDTAGRLIHSASPQTAEYSFSLPAKGIYIIDAETENDHKTVKLMVK